MQSSFCRCRHRITPREEPIALPLVPRVVLRTIHTNIGNTDPCNLLRPASWDDPTTEGSHSYAARAVTIGKGTHALKEIPQSITVMTRQQMDDQGLTDLKDAANMTTGMVAVGMTTATSPAPSSPSAAP